MATRRITADMLDHELLFTTSRSSGPGGQNVNKVNSRVTLHFDLMNSKVLTAEEKNAIAGKLASRLTREGVLSVTAQESRSQSQNKEAAIEKFEALLQNALKKRKKRKPTKPSKSAVQGRIKKKKVQGEKKKWRRKPGIEG